MQHVCSVLFVAHCTGTKKKFSDFMLGLIPSPSSHEISADICSLDLADIWNVGIRSASFYCFHNGSLQTKTKEPFPQYILYY